MRSHLIVMTFLIFSRGTFANPGPEVPITCEEAVQSFTGVISQMCLRIPDTAAKARCGENILSQFKDTNRSCAKDLEKSLEEFRKAPL